MLIPFLGKERVGKEIVIKGEGLFTVGMVTLVCIPSLESLIEC